MLIKCPTCGSNVSSKAKCCPKCGCTIAKSNLIRTCPECGIEIDEDAEICPNCAYPIKENAKRDNIKKFVDDFAKNAQEKSTVILRKATECKEQLTSEATKQQIKDFVSGKTETTSKFTKQGIKWFKAGGMTSKYTLTAIAVLLCFGVWKLASGTRKINVGDVIEAFNNAAPSDVWYQTCEDFLDEGFTIGQWEKLYYLGGNKSTNCESAELRVDNIKKTAKDTWKLYITKRFSNGQYTNKEYIMKKEKGSFIISDLEADVKQFGGKEEDNHAFDYDY